MHVLPDRDVAPGCLYFNVFDGVQCNPQDYPVVREVVHLLAQESQEMTYEAAQKIKAALRS